MKKTIYIRDKSLWATVKHLARAKGISVSTLICLALREYVRTNPPDVPLNM